MADTSQHEELSEPHTNGVMDGLTEEEKSKMRPADIDAVNITFSVISKFHIHILINISKYYWKLLRFRKTDEPQQQKTQIFYLNLEPLCGSVEFGQVHIISPVKIPERTFGLKNRFWNWFSWKIEYTESHQLLWIM